MPGLLGDVLPWVYSRADAAKRQVNGLLSDPVGSIQQAMGQLRDSDRAQQGLLSRAFANPQRPFQLTDSNALQEATRNMLTGPLGFAPVGITAWHGSPHTFDRFDSSKIGTGEGAQAYGHGLYLAESPEVAKSYQTTLTMDRGFNFGGKSGLTREQVQDLVNAREGGKYLDGVTKPSGVADQVIDDIVYGRKGEIPRGYKPDSERAALYQKLMQEVRHTDSGALYKVDLPDDAIAKMLDWDKPLSQQSDAVRKPLEALIAKARAKAEVSGVRPQYWPPNVQQAQEMSGEMLRRTLGDTFPSIGMGRFETAARDAGIPGIRYLDGGSRATGGTSNFVVFPGEESMLQILERNGQSLR